MTLRGELVANRAMRELIDRIADPSPAIPTDVLADVGAGLVVRDDCLLLQAYDLEGGAGFRDQTDRETSINDLTLWSGDLGAPWDAVTLAAVGRAVVQRLGDLVVLTSHHLPVRLVLSIDPPFANVRLFSLRPDEAPWIEEVDGVEQPVLLLDVSPSQAGK